MSSHNSLWDLFLSEVEKQEAPYKEPLTKEASSHSSKEILREAFTEYTGTIKTAATKKKPVLKEVVQRQPFLESSESITSLLMEDYQYIVNDADGVIPDLIRIIRSSNKGTSEEKEKAVKILNEFKSVLESTNSKILRYINELKSNKNIFYAEEQAYRNKTIELFTRMIQSEVLLNLFRDNIQDKRNSTDIKEEEAGDEKLNRGTPIISKADGESYEVDEDGHVISTTTSKLLSSRRTHTVQDMTRKNTITRDLNISYVNKYIDNLVKDIYENSNVYPIPLKPSRGTRDEQVADRERALGYLRPVFEVILDTIRTQVVNLTADANNLLQKHLEELKRFKSEVKKDKNAKRPMLDLENTFFTWKKIDKTRSITLDTHNKNLHLYLRPIVVNAVRNISSSVEGSTHEKLIDDKSNDFIQSVLYDESSNINIGNIIINKIALIDMSYNESTKKKQETINEDMLDSLYGAIFNTTAKSTEEKTKKIRGYVKEYAMGVINNLESGIKKSMSDNYFTDLISLTLSEFMPLHVKAEKNNVENELLLGFNKYIQSSIRSRKAPFSINTTGIGDDYRAQYGDLTTKEERNKSIAVSTAIRELVGKSPVKGVDTTTNKLPVSDLDLIKDKEIDELAKTYPGVPTAISRVVNDLIGLGSKGSSVLDESTKYILQGNEGKVAKKIADILNLKEEQEIIKNNPDLLNYPEPERKEKIKKIKEEGLGVKAKLKKQRDNLRLWFINMGISPDIKNPYDFNSSINDVKIKLKSKVDPLIEVRTNLINELEGVGKIKDQGLNKKYDELYNRFTKDTKNVIELSTLKTTSLDKLKITPEVLRTFKSVFDSLSNYASYYVKDTEEATSGQGLPKDVMDYTSRLKINNNTDALTSRMGIPKELVNFFFEEVNKLMESDNKADKEKLSTILGEVIDVLLSIRGNISVCIKVFTNYEKNITDHNPRGISNINANLINYEAAYKLLISTEKEYKDTMETLDTIESTSKANKNEEMKNRELKEKEKVESIISLLNEEAENIMKNIEPDAILSEIVDEKANESVYVNSKGIDALVRVNQIPRKVFMSVVVGKDDVLAIYEPNTNKFLPPEFNTDEFNIKEIRDQDPLDLEAELNEYLSSKDGSKIIIDYYRQCVEEKFVESANRWAFKIYVQILAENANELYPHKNKYDLKKELLGNLKQFLGSSQNRGYGVLAFNKFLEDNQGVSLAISPKVISFVEYINQSVFNGSDLLVIDDITKLIVYNPNAKLTLAAKLPDSISIAKSLANKVVSKIETYQNNKKVLSTLISEKERYIEKIPLGDIAAVLKGMAQSKDQANQIQLQFEKDWIEYVQLLVKNRQIEVEADLLENLGVSSKNKLFAKQDRDNFDIVANKATDYLNEISDKVDELLAEMDEEVMDEEGDSVPLSQFSPDYAKGLSTTSILQKLKNTANHLQKDINKQISLIEKAEQKDESEDVGIDINIFSELDGPSESTTDEDTEAGELFVQDIIGFVKVGVDKYVELKSFFDVGASQEAILKANDMWEKRLERVKIVEEAQAASKGGTKGVKQEGGEEEDVDTSGLSEDDKMLLEMGLLQVETPATPAAKPKIQDTRVDTKIKKPRANKKKPDNTSKAMTSAQVRTLSPEEREIGMSITIVKPTKKK
jgi:hypothetical protein